MRGANVRRFEWSEEKYLTNYKKHGTCFEEAETVWLDTHSLEFFDFLHSVDEDRFVRVGVATSKRLLTIVFTERGEQIRIISARKATAPERKQYEEGI